MRSIWKVGVERVAEAGLLTLFILTAYLSLNLSCVDQTLPDSSASELLRRAEEAFQEGKTAEFMLLSWHARLKDPGSVQARLNIALVYYLNKWVKEAEGEVDRIIERDPRNVQARLLKARLLSLEGEIERANREYELALSIDPLNPEAHYYLGVNLQATDPARAEEELRAAIRGDPDLKQPLLDDYPYGLMARLQLGRLLYEQGKLDDAIAILEEGYSLRPDYKELTSQLVDYLKKKAETYKTGYRDYLRALEIYERIVRIDPNDYEAWEWIGKINRFFLDDYETALKAFKKAYKLTNAPEYLANVREIELLLKEGR